MLSGCESLPRPDLSRLDTTGAADLTGMFENRKNIHTLRSGCSIVIRSDAESDNMYMFTGSEKPDKSSSPKARKIPVYGG